MQINTSNIPRLKACFPEYQHLKTCCNILVFNISVGGYILNENFKQYGRKWLAVGVYNAGSKNNDKRVKIRYNYAREVNLYYNQIKRKELVLPKVS